MKTINKFPSQLPGGQQQRVVIARGVADRMYFFDEGLVIESGSPKDISENPQEERTKLFLSQILQH